MPVNGAQRAAEAVGTWTRTAQHFYRKVALGTPHRIDHLRHTLLKPSALRKAIAYGEGWGARAWGVDRQPRDDRHSTCCTAPRPQTHHDSQRHAGREKYSARKRAKREARHGHRGRSIFCAQGNVQQASPLSSNAELHRSSWEVGLPTEWKTPLAEATTSRTQPHVYSRAPLGRARRRGRGPPEAPPVW